MKKKENDTKEREKRTNKLTPKNKRETKKKLPGYPPYPQKDDIYNKEEKADEIDPDDNSKMENDVVPGEMNEKDFDDDMTGEDLDVPGAELDDDMEDIGEEDEENNYYSLGGDNHDD
ncbi:MAG TPA: hypothetical protein VI112_03475 [Bacteroidia bacterium]|jgi:hypothetical protein